MKASNADINAGSAINTQSVIDETDCGSCQIETHEPAPTVRDEVHRIIKTIAAQAGTHVTLDQVMGKSRQLHIIEVRHQAMAEVHRRFPWMSYPQMGRLFRRDHTSILSALRRRGVWKPRLLGCSGRNMNARIYGPAIDFLFVRVGAALSASAEKGATHENP